MPSSTDLPTPVPANRPMRWPRPTVSIELMARTPVSSGWRTGSRSIALIERRTMGSSRTSASGPRRSSGWPCASTTRPSRPAPIGRCRPRSSLRRQGWLSAPKRGGRCGTARGTTFAPLDRPCSSPVGMRKARSPSKPTTSAETGGSPAAPLTSQTAPTGTRTPAASSTRPVTRTSVPCISSGCGTVA
jgi:hypothetical protein